MLRIIGMQLLYSDPETTWFSHHSYIAYHNHDH